MSEPTTDKEWAAYLSDLLGRLDALAEKRASDAASLPEYVNEVRKPLAQLIGYLIG
jgi:hypothetical protein